MGLLLELLFALLLFWAVNLYSDFICRDPLDFDHFPVLGKVVSCLLLSAPFGLYAFGVHLKYPFIHSAVVSIAVTTLIIPAAVLNVGGPGLSWLGNMVVKSVAGMGMAAIVAAIVTRWASLSWYVVAVVIGYLLMNSRGIHYLIVVQEDSKSDEWNDARVAAMQAFFGKAKIAYLVIALALSGLVKRTVLGVDNWTNGWKQLLQELRVMLGW